MHVKTMEGLVGAGTNMNLLNTPLRVFKEARRRGDTATMERAMGYVSEFDGKVEEYKAETDEGMKEDAKDAKEKAELEREKAIQKREEEGEELETGTVENKKKLPIPRRIQKWFLTGGSRCSIRKLENQVKIGSV